MKCIGILQGVRNPCLGFFHVSKLRLMFVITAPFAAQDDQTGVKTYRASSPDEEALVKAARVLGYDLIAPAPFVSVRVDYDGQPRDLVYEILNVNEFNSNRCSPALFTLCVFLDV